MTGSESVLGFRRIWQSLLMQLVCQALLVAGLIAGDAVASATGSYDIGYATTLAVTTVAFVGRMVAWLQVVAALGGLRDASTHVAAASAWCLASFGLTFCYLVVHSVTATLEVGGGVAVALSVADQVASTLRDVAPLVALAQLMWGYEDYLESLGEGQARLASLKRTRTCLTATALVEVVLAALAICLGAVAADSQVSSVLSLLLVVVSACGFLTQVICAAQARSVLKTLERMVG